MKMVPAPPPMTSSPIMSSSSHQQFQVTEDTPVDFLEGCMEILVVFPNEKSILMSIQRRMPMLDLLIHVTAANKISPAAHLLQVTDEEGRLLPHKPSTPIGSLNAHKVYIVAKNRLMADRSGGRSTNAKSSSASQFEQSFRVQVRLPRNQLFVTRVTGRTQLADLLHTVCNEKALDPRHYELRHPVNLDERLRLNSCLDDYKLQEVVLVPLCGKSSATLLTPAVSVSDLSSPQPSSNSMNRKSATVTVSNSSKMSGKSTLKPTTSEAALAGLEKKKRGLLGLLGFGKHKKGSSMGDSSISSDSAGDRSISPSRSEEPAPPPPVVEPVAPTPPSPVLFSKRLAEEAVAKRNSRLMLSQMSTEASTTTSPNDAPPLRKTISTTSNGVAASSATKPGAKKKRAPAPPQPQSSLNGMNGPPKAASEVSTYSTSSSGSNYVSPSTSVIHHSEEEVVLRSPSPKLSYQRQESNNVARQRQADSGCSSPVRSPRSNLITTPGNSSSNLTQVSSTSNASLASAIKKRKAPVPPPALEEQVETSEKIPPATPVVVVVVNGGSHDDSDRASSVSDQLSSVSDMSSTRKSAPTPDIIEPPIVVQLTPQHHHQPSSDLDSPRSSEGDSSNATSERPANSVSSEDDYELLNYRREKIEPAIVEKNGPFSEAHEKEEVVVSEPIYTMVIKSPRPLVAVNVEPEKDDKSGQTNGDVHVDEPDRMEVKASPIPAEEGPEMERDAGDGQTESPIMWEYKLPAPPTPFQDSIQSPLDKLQIASESDSSRSRRSSMSTDSLQHNRSAEEEDLVKDSPRSSIGSQEEPVAPQVVPKISIKADCDTNEDAIKLDLGAELQGESATEEPAVNGPPVEEVVKVVVVAEEEKVVVLQSSDPEAKPYGVESTTDEPLSLEPTSLPPVPSTLPPCDSDDDSIGQPDMRFSIATYTVRVNKDSTYEKKLARSGSPEELTKVQIEPVAVPEKKVDDPLPLVAETKGPETIADPVKTEENSGNSSAAVPPAAQLPLPMLNADFIQQFQNALHSITDPKARALQEEFLRLQQQFLTLQMQTAVQQNVTPVSTESTSVAAHCETIKVEDKVVEIDVPKVLDPPIEFSVESDSKQIRPVESPVEKPVEIPLKTIDPIQDQLQKEQIEVEPEATVYRYAGPPQVKLDTWKPGRPRSEVIDFSRSSSFNVPLAPVEKKIDLPVKNTPAPTVAAMESPVTPTVATIPEQVVVVPAQLSEIAEEESKIKSIVIVPQVEEMSDVREKIEHIESSSNNSSSSTSPVPKPVVLRKSSFMTARPFEARPVSMPIKRPNFTPMVIQPVPFVFGKIRAPEVRGFASLPPDNRSEMQSIRTTGSAGIAPFSAVNKPRPVSTVSKENPTVVIRNKLIESARRPSAELNGIPIKLEDSSDQLETAAEVKESVPIVSETRRASNSSRPLSMPMSSSLLLAAGAGGAVNKPQPVVSEISIQPISPTAQQSVVSGADPTSISGRRSLSSKFVRKVDPREELLNSIRSFANGGSLKKTGTSLEK